MLPWKKRRMRQLSTYIDGELAAEQSISLGEDLVFDANLRHQLAEYESLDALVAAALCPNSTPEAEAFASGFGSEIPAPPIDLPQAHRHFKPMVIAAAGILVTAGLTLASLRRRGIV